MVNEDKERVVNDALVQAATVGLRTLADGTLRLTVDIEPSGRKTAFELFGAPGDPLVLARLRPEAAASSARRDTVEQAEGKGGALARLAGRLCADAEFRAWFARSEHTPIASADEAAVLLRKVCGIDSRAKLDHDPKAAKVFHQRIRIPFVERSGVEA